MIYLIAGCGGFSGEGGFGPFSGPSPMNQLIVPICEATSIGIRVDHGDWNEPPEVERLQPQFEGEPLMLIGHSFGGDAAVEIATRHIGECHLILIDPVNPSSWWSPVQWPWQLPSNVKSATCYMRDGLSGLAPPYHGSIVLDRAGFVNVHEPNSNHNSIVGMVQGRVIQAVRELFGPRTEAA